MNYLCDDGKLIFKIANIDKPINTMLLTIWSIINFCILAFVKKLYKKQIATQDIHIIAKIKRNHLKIFVLLKSCLASRIVISSSIGVLFLGFFNTITTIQCIRHNTPILLILKYPQ